MNPSDVARRAYAEVSKVASLPAGHASRKKFRTHAMNGPVLLRQAGTAQAVAFWRRTPDGKEFSNALAKVLSKPEDGTDWDGDRLLKRLMTLEQPKYISAAREIVRAANWIRRFAQAELSD